ncbi:hypothetical protein PAPHI01_0795 [Pancytospora philotis]|nr:hypothetical protein PAPHI01_0795 [Pancytospora philotis]
MESALSTRCLFDRINTLPCIRFLIALQLVFKVVKVVSISTIIYTQHCTKIEAPPKAFLGLYCVLNAAEAIVLYIRMSVLPRIRCIEDFEEDSWVSKIIVCLEGGLLLSYCLGYWRVQDCGWHKIIKFLIYYTSLYCTVRELFAFIPTLLVLIIMLLLLPILRRYFSRQQQQWLLRRRRHQQELLWQQQRLHAQHQWEHQRLQEELLQLVQAQQRVQQEELRLQQLQLWLEQEPQREQRLQFQEQLWLQHFKAITYLSKDNISDGNYICIICFDSYAPGNRVVFLPCRHHFHIGCICVWFRTQKMCPLCRKRIFLRLNASMRTSV